jgi:hypothetical protein
MQPEIVGKISKRKKKYTRNHQDWGWTDKVMSLKRSEKSSAFAGEGKA